MSKSKISLKNGRILSANMDNLVQARSRECSDAALLNCGESSDHTIRRQSNCVWCPSSWPRLVSDMSSRKIPALGYALLGLLQQKPSSGYQLRRYSLPLR